MLEALRNSVNSWIAKVLLGLLVLSFAVWGISDVFMSRTESTIATVGEAEIEADEYARALSDRLNAFRQQTGRAVTLSEARQLGLDQVVLAQLTTRTALNEEARKLGLSASADAVRDAIREAPSFQNALGNFDRDTYERRVQYSGRSIAEFEGDVRDDLAREALLQAIGAGTSAPRSLVEALYRHRNEERVFEYVVLDASAAPDPGEPDEVAVAAFHADNAARFTAPEYRDVAFAWLTPEAMAEEIEIDQDAIAEAYGGRIAEFTRPATRTLDQLLFPTEAEAEAALAKIEDGASFASIADAQGVSRQDASLGRVERDELPDALAEAAFAATEPGVIGPVQSAFGWTLLNIRGVESERIAPLSEVQDKLRDELALFEARERIVEEAIALDDELAGGASLQEAARLTSAKFAEVTQIDPRGRDADGNRPDALPALPDLLARAFEVEQGEVPQMVEVDGGGFFALRVDTITDAALRPLDAVRDDVIAAWKQRQRIDALADLAVELRAAMEDGATLDGIAAERDLELRDSGPVRRSATLRGVPDAVLDKVFTAEAGDVIDGEGDGDTYLFGRLKEVVSVEPDELEQAIDQASERYAAQLAQDMVQTFSRSAQERNETLLYPRVIDATLGELGQRF